MRDRQKNRDRQAKHQAKLREEKRQARANNATTSIADTVVLYDSDEDQMTDITDTVSASNGLSKQASDMISTLKSFIGASIAPTNASTVPLSIAQIKSIIDTMLFNTPASVKLEIKTHYDEMDHQLLNQASSLKGIYDKLKETTHISFEQEDRIVALNTMSINQLIAEYNYNIMANSKIQVLLHMHDADPNIKIERIMIDYHKRVVHDYLSDVLEWNG